MSGLSDCRPSRRSWITMRRLKCDNPLWIFKVTTFSRSISPLTEHHDRVAIGPGEAFCRRLAPRQPDEAKMLAARHAHRHAPGQPHSKHMLDVVQHARARAGARGARRASWLRLAAVARGGGKMLLL